MATSASSSEEISSLAASIHKTVPITPQSQIHERLQILESWFSSIEAARAALSNKTILELGCGQGDTTIALSGLTSDAPDTKIFALDPGPLDYGSPMTLGQAQAKISQSPLGGRISWIQGESTEYIAGLEAGEAKLVPDYVLLAHSLFYLPSEDYLLNLLKCIQKLSTASSQPVTLLLAEWGMHATHGAAKPHIAAVLEQAELKIPDGNIRTLFYPHRIQEIAKKAGWEMEQERWLVPEEDVDDGAWEVATARRKGERDEKEVEEMKKAVEERVRSMDVWCARFA